MRTNWTTQIVGNKVVLVPYREAHVVKYHKWMKSEELQELTGSEPLTLEQEKEMQKTWREDKDKCTFIVLNKESLHNSGEEICAMVGDTNLFLSGDGCAEAEIMIAEVDGRGKKMGWEAMLLMLRYGIEMLGINRYEVKIKMENMASIKMFKKIGFKEESRSEVFNEVTSVLEVTSGTREWLEGQTEWRVEEYKHLDL
eukprot:GFUD01014113.1.p1 GENE.GFUD01014113.1~~GFUD01014113.1.p1  ORF type:complete len:198 (+),score=79.12 GFUD01014113.1:43-636(+)